MRPVSGLTRERAPFIIKGRRRRWRLLAGSAEIMRFRVVRQCNPHLRRRMDFFLYPQGILRRSRTHQIHIHAEEDFASCLEMQAGPLGWREIQVFPHSRHAGCPAPQHRGKPD